MALDNSPRWQHTKVFFAFVVVFSLSAVVCYFFYNLFMALQAARPEFALAILTASGTVIVSVISVLAAKRSERMSEIRRDQRDKKIQVYEKLIGFWFKMLTASSLGEDPLTEIDMRKFFVEFTKELIPWGGDGVVKAFSDWKVEASKLEDGTVTKHSFTLFERLLLEIRKDLGHANKNFIEGDILRIFINDYDEYLHGKLK